MQKVLSIVAKQAQTTQMILHLFNFFFVHYNFVQL